MPTIESPLEDLDEDALKVALEAADALMSLKQFMPRGGLLFMMVSRFRDDIREALGLEPERYSGRGKVFRSLDEMTTSELGAAWGAVAILLQGRFTAVMDDPELARHLLDYQAELSEQKTDREQIQASIAS